MNGGRLLEQYERILDAPDAVEQLRRFTLDLAVRGKLVSQDPADEPASELLRRITAEKLRSASKNGRARAKPYEDIPKDAEPFSLPASWKWVHVRAVTDDRGQCTPSGDFTYIDVTAINKEVGRIESAKVIAANDAPSRARKVIKPGDVLYSCVRPTLLNVAIVESGIVPVPIASTAFAVLNGFGLVLARYLWIVLRSPFFVACVEEKMRGQAYPAINDSDFAKLPLPLPPFAEQQRVVDKFDELMSLFDQLEVARTKSEKTRDRLAAASLAKLNVPDAKTLHDDVRFALNVIPHLTTRPDQIKQLRTTVLKLAVRGKLVSQNMNDEPASILLRRIGTELADVGPKRGRQILPFVDEKLAPFGLPSGWTWARFPELGKFGRGKSKHRPRNDPTLFDGGTHFVIQTGDVARGKGVVKTYTSKYNERGLAQSLKWPKGTLCITIAANIADSGILDFDACFPDSVVGFCPSPILENARYFEYFLRTAKANLLAFAPATAQKNINLEILTAVLIPLPPLNEQRRIVKRLDEFMSLCDQLEASLSTGQRTRTRLLEALLHEAIESVDGETEPVQTAA